MSRLLCLICSLAMVLLVDPVQALSAPKAAPQRELTRYWQTSTPSAPSGRDPVSIYFYPNSKRCQERYGNKGFMICSRRTGMNGRPGEGVSLEPAVPGEWRWTSDTTLTFTPQKAWPAGKRFSVKLSGDPLSSPQSPSTRRP